MTEIIGNQIKLNNGKLITPQQGGWYDARQYWGGTLSEAGVINSQSNQQGAGQAVSPEVNRQTSVAAGLAPDANQQYIEQQKQVAAAAGQPAVSTAIPGAGAGTPGAGAGAGIGMTAAPTINLPDLYKTLYASAGISDLETKLSDQDKAFADAQSKINDNPFLSEATRVGRVAKLQTDYNNNTANLRNQIATKKADVETQLNLETKQFDINSQAARDALSQFNTLLGMGALDGASGDDIAMITRTTGLSSAAIQSAINANRAKNVQTQVITSTADDGTVTATVINSDTGAIIKSTSLGKVGNAQNGSVTQIKAQEEEQNRQNLITSVKNYNNLRDIVSSFQGVMSIDEIYRLYNLNSPFGKAKETLEQVQEGKFKT